MKYVTRNGWTVAATKQAIMDGNKGKRAHIYEAADTPGKGGGCLYLTPDGNKCAVGCFIPDGHEGQSLRGSVHMLLASHRDLEDSMPLHRDALAELQEIHDEGYDRNSDDPRPALLRWIDANVTDTEVPT